MNVIISNKNKAMLENLGIEVMKEMEGEFSVDEIISTFQNLFYQRMLLDITAIKNYRDITNLQKLSISLDMSKVILILDSTDTTTNPTFLSQLISMGIYNFTSDINGIQYLYNTPNSYKDVAQYQSLGINTVQTTQPTGQQMNMQPIVQTVYVDRYMGPKTARIIGFKNLTIGAGATTLTYLMKKKLEKNYSVVAIEVDKTDFTYFRDKNLYSTTNNDIAVEIGKYKENDIILVDINKSVVAESICNEVIYLMEPSILKLNKMVTLNPGILETLKGKKIVLTKSLLSEKDITDLSQEARMTVFYNLLPFNDRNLENQNLDNFISLFGFHSMGG